MKPERPTQFIITDVTISLAQYLLLLCQALESVSDKADKEGDN